MEQYVSMIRRWLWLIILLTLIASVATYLLGREQQTVYEATARLIVGPGVDSPSPDLNSLRTSSQLLQTYAELTTTRPVLQVVIDNLGLNLTPNQLRQKVDVRFNQEAQILTVSVQDDEPQTAVVIVNTLAAMVVRMSPSSSTSPTALLKDQMRSQAEKLELDVANMEARISQLESDFQTTEDLAVQRLLLDQLSGERNRLADANRTLAILYQSLQQATTNQVKIIEPADNAFLVPSQLRLQVLIGALAGLVLAVVIAMTIEFFDDTIKSTAALAKNSDSPILGTVSKHKTLRGTGRNGLVVEALPESQAAEDYRILGTKLLLANGSNEPLRSVLFGSTHVREETGEMAANLAVILAQTGSRVVLVDANLNQPSLGSLVGEGEDGGGLTDFLTGKVAEPKLVRVDWAPDISVLPTGPVSHDSFALLSSPRMVQLLQQLEGQADMVLLAASSLLSFADSLLLASRVDGVVVVVHAGKTRRDMLGAVLENLRSLNANIIGTVLDYNRSFSLPIFSRQLARLTRAEESRPPYDEEVVGQAAAERAQGSVKHLKSAEF